MSSTRPDTARPDTARTDTARTARSGRRGPPARRRRQAALIVHIGSAGVWLGVDAVLVVLVFTTLLSDDVATVALALQSLGTFVGWPLLVAGLVCLASGIVLGLDTGYGLLKYWWVAAKLAITVVLVGLIAFVLGPTLPAVAQYGREFALGQPLPPDADTLVYPAVVAPSALLVALVLSVLKPWGRIRGSRGDR